MHSYLGARAYNTKDAYLLNIPMSDSAKVLSSSRISSSFSLFITGSVVWNKEKHKNYIDDLT